MNALASDNFNRANGGLGANWTTIGTGQNPLIVSNQVQATAVNSGFAEAYYNAISWPDNQYAQCVVVAVNATGGFNLAGVLTRAASGADTHYYAVVGTLGASAAVEISKHVAGAYTQLTSGTSAFSANDMLKLVSSGSNHTMYHNTTQILTTSDSAITNGSSGIMVDPDFGSSLTDAIIDTYVGGDLSIVLNRIIKVLQTVNRAATY